MATPNYINDATLLILKLIDSDGNTVPDLSIFDNIVFWLQNDNGNKAVKTWSVDAETAVITTAGDKVKLLIDAGDLQDAAVRNLQLFAKYYLTENDADLGIIDLSKSVSYSLFNLLTHAKSYEL